MRTLHWYLTRQVIATLLMTVAVFTFVLLLGNALREILPLLVTGQVSFGAVSEAIGLLVPFVWVFALPMGMLTATLLTFGRFSADQELTATRASGISLLSLVSPVLLLSLALCVLSAYVNMELGPRCRVAYNRLLFRLKVEFSNVHLPEGRFIKDFKDYIFYIGKNRRGELEDVWVFHLTGDTVDLTMRAPKGKLEVDSTNKVITVSLYDGKAVSLGQDRSIPGSFGEYSLNLDMKPDRKPTPKIDDMTFFELRQQLRELERTLGAAPSIQGLTAADLKEKRKELRKQTQDVTAPVVFHMHRQVAFSFACFGFTLVGIPLGIRVHRRETNIGIAIALLLVAVYYSFILLGSALTTRSEFLPYLIVWVPNFLFQIIGAVLLHRANRGL